MHDAKIFQLEEYKSLRKEVEIYIAETRSQERYTLIAVGAIWAFLLGKDIHDSLPWMMPIFLTLAAALRSLAMGLHFSQTGKRIAVLEDHFGVAGWQHRQKKPTVGAANAILSLLLFALTIIAWQIEKST